MPPPRFESEGTPLMKVQSAAPLIYSASSRLPLCMAVSIGPEMARAGATGDVRDGKLMYSRHKIPRQ